MGARLGRSEEPRLGRSVERRLGRSVLRPYGWLWRGRSVEPGRGRSVLRPYGLWRGRLRPYARVVRWVAMGLVLLSAGRAGACEGVEPWARLGAGARAFAEPLPLALTAGAVVAPVAMSPTGADAELRIVAQRELGGRANLEPVSVLVPYALPVALAGADALFFAFGACELARPTSAMLQAVAVSALGVGLVKLVTSRSWPNAGQDPSEPERVFERAVATEFHWFDPDLGWAFPSGHTAVMVAAAASLATVTSHRHWSGYVAYGAAAAVAAGMWLGDHHWASDIVSGALFGFAVGHSAGVAFHAEADAPAGFEARLLPFSTGTASGVLVGGRF